MKLIYLAQPYTHPEDHVRVERFVAARHWTARLMRHGAVFSPIVHGHTVESLLTKPLADPHKFWMAQCIPILRKSDVMAVLAIPGWRESKGLRDELSLCVYAKIPVQFIMPTDPEARAAMELPSPMEAAASGWEFLYV